jgi:hypothetical protein
VLRELKLANNMWIIFGVLIVLAVSTILHLCTTEVKSNNSNPENLWTLDQRSTTLSEDDLKIFEEHINNPREPNANLKEAAKIYKNGKN